MSLPAHPLSLPAYPRTPHLVGSGLPGDGKVARNVLSLKPLVVEEKVDGFSLALLFDEDGELHVGHGSSLVDDDPRLKTLWPWLHSLEHRLLDVLEDRYVLYGEWLEQKHTVFYDSLPHYFLEYDLYDRDLGEFLDTPGRRRRLDGLGLTAVSILATGVDLDLDALLGPSRYKGPHWRESLAEAGHESGADPERVRAQTLLDDRCEGLYVKVEREGIVSERYKLVRPEFVAAILASDSHWSARRPLRNRLRDGISLFD